MLLVGLEGSQVECVDIRNYVLVLNEIKVLADWFEKVVCSTLLLQQSVEVSNKEKSSSTLYLSPKCCKHLGGQLNLSVE